MSIVTRYFFLSVCLVMFAVVAPYAASAHPSANPHVHKPQQPQGETPVIERTAEDVRRPASPAK